VLGRVEGEEIVLLPFADVRRVCSTHGEIGCGRARVTARAGGSGTAVSGSNWPDIASPSKVFCWSGANYVGARFGRGPADQVPTFPGAVLSKFPRSR